MRDECKADADAEAHSDSDSDSDSDAATQVPGRQALRHAAEQLLRRERLEPAD
jgi:hypothetical protein